MEGEPVPDDDTREWRETMIDWVEQLHREVRAVRVMIQVFFVVWLLSFVVGIIGVVVAAQE
jgi:hypothetical protein